MNLPVGTKMTLSISNLSMPIIMPVGDLSMNFLVFAVMKFKQRPRFLEFFTQVMLKCMNDEKFQIMVEITNPVHDFLKRYLPISILLALTTLKMSNIIP